MRLIIVRHGAADWSGILGQSDAPLSPDGQRQASLTGARLTRFAAARILCSDLRRAAQTAQIIGRSLQLTPQPVPALRERSFGLWEGLSPDDIQRLHPTLYAAWRRGDAIVPPGGESGQELRKRALAALEFIDTRPAVIVTHLGMIRALVSAVTGISAQSVRRLRFDHCGLSVIELSPSAELSLINDTCHLV